MKRKVNGINKLLDKFKVQLFLASVSTNRTDYIIINDLKLKILFMMYNMYI